MTSPTPKTSTRSEGERRSGRPWRSRRPTSTPRPTTQHALTQEVAYQTLLTAARKTLHNEVGTALESLFHDRLNEFAGVLAYHYLLAESWEKGLQYSIQAADAAFRP